MSRVRLYPYKAGSKSARDLSRALGIKRIKREGSRFVARPRDIIINWGCSFLPRNVHRGNYVINLPGQVGITVNKIEFHRWMETAEQPTLEYTVDKNEAIEWLRQGCPVVSRTLINSHSGNGIIITECGNLLPDAPLYTKLIKRTDEYRCHVMRYLNRERDEFAYKVFDFSKKKKRRDTEVHPHIKTWTNGWVFCREGVELPAKVECEAKAVLKCLGLDFCCIDFLVEKDTGTVRVIEANSAPALEGTTLTRYTEAMRRIIDDYRN